MKQSTLKSFIIKPAAAAVPRNEIQRDQITAKPDNRQPRPSAKRKAPHNDPDTARAYELKRRRCFLSHWLDEYAWLRFDQVNGVMYCYVCRELKHLYQSSDIAMITGAGEPSFRKGTLDSHGTSMYHTKCMDVFHARQRPQEMPLAIIRRRMNLQSQEMYYNLFTSAYCVGLRNWSFRDFEYLCQLQAKNGVNIGNNYQNTHGVQTFIESIAHIQRSDTALGLQQSRFFSLAADGSTDHGVAEQESVYVRYLVAGEPVNKFLGLHEVEHSTSDGVLAAIDTVLFQHADISLETQKQKLVNVNLDGAAVNMGMYNGVGALEKQRHGPQVTVTHCINHNLELALLDLRKDEPYLAIFEKTIKGSSVSITTLPNEVEN
ncbi:unnamed protein product [Meganyctiphanes norvegica]|uniref:DUF4371 domain-containing protein n=2 Tax=Meganyctiphanes norvegica TaxID=48144 RepID=A0AAV2SGH4_MEGNR